MADLPEEDQIRRAVAGDRDAVSTLLKQYGPPLQERLRGEIGARWKSLLDVDDVIQVTLLEVFLRIGKFEDRGPGSFEAWLARIARNNLMDAIRSLERAGQWPVEKRVTIPGGADSSWALMEALGVTSDTPSRTAVTEETHARLREAVAQLPRDYAQVLTLYDLEGNSAEQVASIMQRTTGAVYMLRARALDYLRETLGSASQW